jgi:hypothetical protein
MRRLYHTIIMYHGNGNDGKVGGTVWLFHIIRSIAIGQSKAHCSACVVCASIYSSEDLN